VSWLQDAGLLGGELLLGEDAPLLEGRQLLQLGNRIGRGRGRRRGRGRPFLTTGRSSIARSPSTIVLEPDQPVARPATACSTISSGTRSPAMMRPPASRIA
jgi:hypothetical protein